MYGEYEFIVKAVMYYHYGNNSIKLVFLLLSLQQQLFNDLIHDAEVS